MNGVRRIAARERDHSSGEEGESGRKERLSSAIEIRHFELVSQKAEEKSHDPLLNDITIVLDVPIAIKHLAPFSLAKPNYRARNSCLLLHHR
ncbi:hypothetical protein ACLOJK_003706 [Asimina triloba]